MKKLSTRLYERLTPEERFRLALEALARDDEEEMKRLVQACPRKTYLMEDADFINLLEASRLVVAAFCIVWFGAHDRYRMIELGLQSYREVASAFIRGYVLGANNAVKGRGPTDEELEEIDLAEAIDGLSASVQKAIRERAGEVKGVWEGFARFCRAVGVEPKKMLAWCPSVLEDLEEAGDVLNSEAPTDEKKAQSVYTMLCRAWPGEVEQGAGI